MGRRTSLVSGMGLDLTDGFLGRCWPAGKGSIVNRESAAQFIQLDHSSERESERIRDLLFASYTVEARLIGVSSFPPLQRSVEEIRSASSSFFGCIHNDVLLGVAEIEPGDRKFFNIASLGVQPDSFRRGVGTFLLVGILDHIPSRPITVSTASANTPAISLYEKQGFRTVKNWSTPCGISMITLSHSP